VPAVLAVAGSVLGMMVLALAPNRDIRGVFT
jgi:hypothetical protein